MPRGGVSAGDESFLLVRIIVNKYLTLWVNVVRASAYAVSIAIGGIIGISLGRALALNLSFLDALGSTLQDGTWLAGIVGGIVGIFLSRYIKQKGI